MKKTAVNKIVTAALLISISVVLGRFCVIYITPSLRINFGNIPIMLAGLMLGPVYGALAGAGADIVGSVFLSGLGWYPPLTVSAAVMGLIPGLMSRFVTERPSKLRTAAAVFLSDLCGPIMWTTFWLSKLNNTPIWTLAAVRVPLYIGMAVLESAVLFVIIKVILREKKEQYI